MKNPTKKKVSSKKKVVKKPSLLARNAGKLRVTAVILAFTASVFGVDQALRSAKSQGMLKGCVFAASMIASQLTGQPPFVFIEEATDYCKSDLGM